MSHQRTVYLIDDDPQDRHSLAFQLGSLGIEAWPFASGTDFLMNLPHLRPQCIILSMEVPRYGGLQLMTELLRREVDWPVIALSRCGDLSLAVDAMKLGALDFLQKPVTEEGLISALARACVSLESSMLANETRRAAQERVKALTAREIDISLALISGQPNKRVAHELGISVRTVEAHRANIMMKLGVKSLAEVVMLMTQAGLGLTAAPVARTPTRGAAMRPAIALGGGGSSASPAFEDRRYLRSRAAL